MEKKTLTIAAAVAFFFLAFAAFYAGLGAGLIVSPALGNALWILALVLVGAGVFLIVKSQSKK